MPGLTIEERISYIQKEIEGIKDLLQDYKDVKWIYEALLEYTMTLGQLRRKSQSTSESRQQDDLPSWLSKLRELDAMQAGRWDDVGKQLKSYQD